MAFTTKDFYTGDGTTVLFSFTFPYIDERDVRVRLDNITIPRNEYTFANATTLNFNEAPGAGVNIEIYRDTKVDSPENTFYPGSAIRARDLNDNFTQTLYIVQEGTDGSDIAEDLANEALAKANEALDVAEESKDVSDIWLASKENDVVVKGSNKVPVKFDSGIVLPTSSYEEAGSLRYGAGNVEVYNGADWTTISGGGGGGEGGGAEISPTPPSNPVAGDQWWDSVSGRTFIYYVDDDSAQWVEADPGGGGSSSTESYKYPASSVTRLVSDRLADTVSVKDFGAVGDGSTDDTAAVQATVDQVAATGGRVYFPKGDYNFGSINVGTTKIVAVLDTDATIPTNSGLVTLSTTTFDYQGWLYDSPRPGFHLNLLDAGTTTQWGKPYVNSQGQNVGLSESFYYYASGYFLNEPTYPGEVSAYGFDLTTNQSNSASVVRGMKGTVRAEGGSSNVRSMRLMSEGTAGHTGNLTGILQTCIRSDLHNKDIEIQPYFNVGSSCVFQASMGAGTKYGFNVSGFGGTASTIHTTYSVAGNANRIEPIYSHYQCHGKSWAGGGVNQISGNMFTGQVAHDKTACSFVVNSEGYTSSRGFNSGRYSLNTNQVATIVLRKAVGYITIWCDSGGQNRFGQVYFVSNSHCIKCWGGSQVFTHTGLPDSSTNNVDGIHIFSGPDNTLYIKNGTPTSQGVNLQLLVASEFKNSSGTLGTFTTSLD